MLFCPTPVTKGKRSSQQRPLLLWGQLPCNLHRAQFHRTSPSYVSESDRAVGVLSPYGIELDVTLNTGTGKR